jgi:hypothetical protein
VLVVLAQLLLFLVLQSLMLEAGAAVLGDLLLVIR